MIKIAMAMSALGLALAAPAHLKSDANPEDDASAPAPAAPAFNPFPGSYPNPNQWNTPWGPSAPSAPSQGAPAWASANGPYSGAPAPIYSPNSQFNPYNPVYNPYTTAAYPQSNPMHPQWGHPAYNPYHPLNNPWHPANAFPAYPSYEQGAQEAAQASFVATESKSKAKSAPADNNAFSEAQQNWSNYYAGPTSEYTWPGAPEAAPGVHPTLGGKLNPFNPLGAPSHPYPFPMHQGLKNGARHPRPFTATGQYYPGQSEIPPQFFPNPFGTLGYPGAFPYGFQAPTNYFPAAKNGRIQ